MKLTLIECIGGWLVVYAPAEQWVSAITMPDSPSASCRMFGWEV
jgi:hypothetical protein